MITQGFFDIGQCQEFSDLRMLAAVLRHTGFVGSEDFRQGSRGYAQDGL